MDWELLSPVSDIMKITQHESREILNVRKKLLSCPLSLHHESGWKFANKGTKKKADEIRNPIVGAMRSWWINQNCLYFDDE